MQNRLSAMRIKTFQQKGSDLVKCQQMFVLFKRKEYTGYYYYYYF